MNGPLSMIVKVAVAVVLLCAILHDVIAVGMTRYGAVEIAQSTADAAAVTWHSSGRDRSATLLTSQKVAISKNAELIGFSLEDNDVLVQVRIRPRDTFVLKYISKSRILGGGEAIASAPIENK